MNLVCKRLANQLLTLISTLSTIVLGIEVSGIHNINAMVYLVLSSVFGI